MRISDWSSDVCSSDLFLVGQGALDVGRARVVPFDQVRVVAVHRPHEVGQILRGVRMQTASEAVRFALDLDGEVGQHGRYAAFEEAGFDARRRSEEHTSELQSLMRISYAVFCLKKKKQQNTITP